MAFNVIDVGDGACTIVNCPCCSSRSVIDCGTSSHRPGSVKPLLNALGQSVDRVSSLVVTHFHDDHWKGLRSFAPKWAKAKGQRNARMDLYFPGLPAAAARLPPGVVALLSTAVGRPVKALDLIHQWERYSDLHPHPVADGDHIVVGCERWEVLWPPRHLPSAFLSAIDAVLNDMDRLARELADNGDSLLLDNLEEAYERGLGLVGPMSHEERRYVSDIPQPTFADLSIVESRPDADVLPDSTDPVDEHWLSSTQASNNGQPTEFRRLVKRVQSITNDLCLAIHVTDSGLHCDTLVVGDLTSGPLDYLIRNGRIHRHYDLVLAPHHGSHSLPPNFPAAKLCVAQAGKHRYPYWSNHLTTHLGSECVSTRLVGSIYTP